ncbi:hypothetical protein Taro_011047 [Colocasia esculenta]|uniref:Uncharacterized protein n=1 Tax=Colocasia esculenta TaxID=4460 RepID=A0A843U9W4_COLES|nr:hypothetical protein [Colocasia esculenta]
MTVPPEPVKASRAQTTESIGRSTPSTEAPSTPIVFCPAHLGLVFPSSFPPPSLHSLAAALFLSGLVGDESEDYAVLRAAIGHGDFETSPDLVVTEDINGINAGMFFVRRSRWSEAFLDAWWSQAVFVWFNSTMSGDNHALNHLVGDLSDELRRRHIRVSPMQCLFNSYLWALGSQVDILER